MPVVSPIEMGELMCDSLILAEDANALSFVVTNNEIVVAEKLSYTEISGEAFTDNIGRKVYRFQGPDIMLRHVRLLL